MSSIGSKNYYDYKLTETTFAVVSVTTKPDNAEIMEKLIQILGKNLLF